MQVIFNKCKVLLRYIIKINKVNLDINIIINIQIPSDKSRSPI